MSSLTDTNFVHSLGINQRGPMVQQTNQYLNSV